MDPILVPLYSLFAPLLLWPIELYLPLPYLLEEIAKLLIVRFSVENIDNIKSVVKTYFAAGILFSLSETVLYIINYNLFGVQQYLLIRFISSGILHSFTFILIGVLGYKSKSLTLSLAVP